MLARACLSAMFVALFAGVGPAAGAEAARRPAAVATTLPTDVLLSRGVAAFEDGDYAAAARDFRILAQRDVPAAETLLGTMAANGQGAPRGSCVRRGAAMGRRSWRLPMPLPKGAGCVATCPAPRNWPARRQDRGSPAPPTLPPG
jgi:hypothetical protein